MLQAGTLSNLSFLLTLLTAPLPPAPVTASPAAAPAVGHPELERGRSLQKQAKYDDAIRVLAGAAKLKTSAALAAEIRVELAETYFRKGKDAFEGKLRGVEPEPLLKTAASLFSEVVASYPKVEDQASLAAYMTGSSHLLLGDMQKALENYQRAYSQFPTSKHRPKALMRIGVCQAGLGDPAKAKAAYNQFLSTYPKDANRSKIQKYIYQTGIVGKKATPIRASEWLKGVVPNGLSDLRGEVVVVVFFATWCTNCESELPHLKREIERWGRQGVVFLGVANPEDPKAEQPVDFYVDKNQIDFFDVALDRGGRSWTPYRVTGLPAAAVVDRRGIVRWRGHFAFFSHTLLEKLLRE